MPRPPVSLVGQRFGDLVVTGEIRVDNKHVCCECSCVCGVAFRTSRDSLYRRTYTCQHREDQKSPCGRKAIDLTNRTFGRLTVLRRSDKTSRQGALWECVCTCGAHRIVAGRCLLNQTTQSCGCYRRETSAISAANLNERRRRENDSGSLVS